MVFISDGICQSSVEPVKIKVTDFAINNEKKINVSFSCQSSVQLESAMCRDSEPQPQVSVESPGSEK